MIFLQIVVKRNVNKCFLKYTDVLLFFMCWFWEGVGGQAELVNVK